MNFILLWGLELQKARDQIRCMSGLADTVAAAEDAFAALAGKLDEIPPHPLMTAMAAASA